MCPKFFQLADNSEMPALGLGTWKLKQELAEQVITSAIDIGYRHFDCASVYHNEREIGAALGSAISSGKVRRDELFVTSKLWCNAHDPKHVRPALERTLLDLGLDHLDLYLIHWPVSIRADIAFPKRADQFISENELPLTKTWKAMEKMVEKGLCRHIGVSNCNIRRLEEIRSSAKIPPAVNQIELHPYLTQQKMLDYCSRHSITVTAYSPLGSGTQPKSQSIQEIPSLLNHPVICAIAAHYNADPAQILLAWGLARDTVVIPRSTKKEHLKSNVEAQWIQLDTADIKKIDSLDMHYRFLDGSFWAPPGSPYSVTDLWQEEL